MRPLSRRHVKALMAPSRLARIRVYSIQGLDAFSIQSGRWGLWGPPGLVPNGGADWPGAYQWMRAQLARHQGVEPRRYPVWVWPKRPNLRQRYRQASPAYRPHLVVVTADILARHVLWSDWEHWHTVLMQQKLCWSEAEWNDEDQNPSPIEAVRESWTRVLAVPYPEDADSAWLGSSIWSPVLQGCVLGIDGQDIVSIRPLAPDQRRLYQRQHPLKIPQFLQCNAFSDPIPPPAAVLP